MFAYENGAKTLLNARASPSQMNPHGTARAPVPRNAAKLAKQRKRAARANGQTRARTAPCKNCGDNEKGCQGSNRGAHASDRGALANRATMNCCTGSTLRSI